MADLEALLKADLRIHDGRQHTWSIDQSLARTLHTLAPGAVSLETGSGLSTLVLLNNGARHHIAVQPFADEFEAIRGHAAALGVPTGALTAVVAKSQDYLPTAQLPPLDLVLIDGAHGVPFPFIDWYFTALALKVGGTMIVDDAHIATGTFLADFLSNDPAWVEVDRNRVTRRHAVYRKQAAEMFPADWVGQPFLMESFPTKQLKLVKQQPKGPIESIAGFLPWRMQEALRKQFLWPRPRWMK